MKNNSTAFAAISEEEKIDKSSYIPAYAQLANILKKRISDGIYPPGSQLPSESAIAGSYSISAMTARQAVGKLAEEGLIERVQGRGTFVKRMKFTSSNFGLGSLRQMFIEKEKLDVQILTATVKIAPQIISQKLELESGSSVILVERLILHDRRPAIYQVSYALADPKSPFVETMLETKVLNGLLSENDPSNFKKAEFKLLPASLKQKEADLLLLERGESVFKLEHTYYGSDDSPSACGWFLIEPGKMPLICRMGVWND